MKVNLINKFNNEDYLDLINKVLVNSENKLQIKNKSINIILVDNEEIKNLNNTYRKKDKITDVLTFPDGYLNNLGDIFISIPKCISQAEELGHSFDRELGFLVVHGFLHSIGYNHDTIEEEREMTKIQEAVLYKSKLNR